MRSGHGDGLNLDQRARHRQAPTHGRAGGVGRCEECPVDLVVGGVMTPVGQHHRGLDHIVQPQTGQCENRLNSSEDVPGLGPNVTWTYQVPLGIDTGMSTDKHQVTYTYSVHMGNPWSELIRMDYVGPAFSARLSNLSESRVDGESRRRQGGNRLDFNEEPLTPQTSLEGRIGREGRLHVI